MKLNPHLLFNGQCEAALKFYEQCLGGKTAFKITYGESPLAKNTPAERQNQILHARFVVGDNTLLCADAPPERYDEPKGFAVTLGIEAPAEADRIFAALSEKGNVQMPIQETFWALRFGMLVDQFGIPWMINCEKTP